MTVERARASGHRRGRGDKGAALVEFGIIMPILFLLLFGIIEFGWTFYQLNDVRQSARETARLVAVNYKTSDVSGDIQTQQIVDEVCLRMEEGNVDVAITLNGSGVGDSAIVVVERKYDPLTGFLTFAYDPAQIDSTVKIRLEQIATLADEPNESDFGDCP
ncbi:MAG: TadE/TadG family type IV pilus assembly protein [Mycobacterium sp.]